MRFLFSFLTVTFCFLFTGLLAQNSGYQRINNIPVFQNGIKLKNPWAGGLNHPLFSQIDLNGDGIKDLFAYDMSNGRIECFINHGTPDSVDYEFSSDYFNKFPTFQNWVFLRDYNCDYKEDIFTLGDDLKGIKVYKNVSSLGNLQFQLVSEGLLTNQDSLLQTIDLSSNTYPAIIDVDNDGDLDLLYWSRSSPRTVIYQKNISEEGGYGCDSLMFKYETGCWGNFGLSIGANQVGAFDTCLNPPAPIHVFNYDPADAARRDDSVSNIFAFDNDGDGVKDLLIGDAGNPNTLLITNGGTKDASNMVSQDINFPNYDIPVAANLRIFPNHAYIDVDNDGKNDLLVSSTGEYNMNSILFYKNNNTTPSPVFSYQKNSFLQDEMIDVGEGAYPVFFDYDHDGKQDLIIANAVYDPQLNGSIGTGLSLYRNIGLSDTSPVFDLVTTDFANISSLNGLTYPIYAAFGDMDGDGDEDMILGDGSGNLQYFTNTALLGQPANFSYSAVKYFNIDVGGDATPQIIDLDRDGVPDLVIGSQNGYVRYYHNNGTKNSASFNSTPTIDSLGKVNTAFGVSDGFSVPFIYDDSGVYKMFLAGAQGYVIEYGNIDTNRNTTFTVIDTVISLSEGGRLSVAGADLNKDGNLDLVIGNYAGGLGIFSKYLPLPVHELSDITPSFKIFPNPANDNLSLHLYNLKEKEASIYIVDLLGRQVKNVPVKASDVNIDVSGLSAGIYLIELQSSKYQVTKKLVVRH